MNGLVDKADGNFLGALDFAQIGDHQLFVGAYPRVEDDVRKLQEAGITGVLNLQTDEDIAQRQIDPAKLQKIYQ